MNRVGAPRRHAWRAHAPAPARWAIGGLVGATIVYGGWLLAVPGIYVPVRDFVLSGLLVLSCAALMAVRAASVRSERLAWSLIAAGIALWAMADIGYSGFVSRQDVVPYPSWCDWVYLLFYPCAWVGLVLIFLRRSPRHPRTVWLDGLLVALGFAALVWVSIPGIYGGISGGPAAAFMSFASPVFDVLLLCLLAGILGVLGLRAERMWWLLLAGALALWITDSVWLVGIDDHSYSVGAVLDAGWPIAFLLLALAAWQVPHPSEPDELDHPVSAIPVIVTLSVLLLVFIGTQWELPKTSMALAAGAIVVGLWRTAETLRQASVQSELRRQAYLDDLTGLPNRRRLTLEMQCEHQRVDHHEQHQERSGYALMLLDIDGFKEINDSLGHAAGDEVLRALAPRLLYGLRPTDVVARLGGDEFAVLLPETVGVERAVSVAERLRKELNQPIVVADVELQIDVSVGIAVAPDHGRTMEQLMRAADAAMYRAKHAKTGQAVFDTGLDSNDRGHLLFLQQLRAAIAGDQLFCEYQPKVELASGAVVGVEALVRWRHPERGVLAPTLFIPFAERTALIRPLTDRVLQMAVRQMAEWQRQGLDVIVGVNLSATNLLDPDLPGTVASILAQHDAAAGKLILEVTESVFLADPGRARDVIAELRKLGISISIDDYGTGYSSLAQIRTLAACELKLDASFVTGLADRTDQQSIVASTVLLARGLQVKLVAEGIESASDLETVAALGCDQGQGFHICPPLPAREVASWLRRQSQVPSQRSPATRWRKMARRGPADQTDLPASRSSSVRESEAPS